jgi:hypothetical protein
VDRGPFLCLFQQFILASQDEVNEGSIDQARTAHTKVASDAPWV